MLIHFPGEKSGTRNYWLPRDSGNAPVEHLSVTVEEGGLLEELLDSNIIVFMSKPHRTDTGKENPRLQGPILAGVESAINRYMKVEVKTVTSELLCAEEKTQLGMK